MITLVVNAYFDANVLFADAFKSATSDAALS
jgi:hypothetical protein